MAETYGEVMPFKQAKCGNGGLLKKLLETPGTFLQKAVLLHLHSFPITKLHVLQSHCLVAVEIVSQTQKAPCSVCQAAMVSAVRPSHTDSLGTV